MFLKLDKSLHFSSLMLLDWLNLPGILCLLSIAVKRLVESVLCQDVRLFVANVLKEDVRKASDVAPGPDSRVELSLELVVFLRYSNDSL